MYEDFLERRKEMARLSREGWTLFQIGEKFGITRQAVSQHLKKAAKEGNIVELNYHGCPLTRDPNIQYRAKRENPYFCKICGEKCTGNKKKVCGERCRAELIRLNNIKDSKWSRSTIQSLICRYCHKTFERSNYLIAIAQKGGSKNNFCGRECYHAYSRKINDTNYINARRNTG